MSKVIVFGEALFDVIEGNEYLGGAPFNLTCHLKKIGVDVIFVSAVGKDKRGEKIIEAMKKFNLSRDFISIVEDYPTGIVNVKLIKGHPDFEIVYPSAWDFIDLEEEKIRKLYNEEVEMFCFGSLALRSEKTKNTFLRLDSILKNCKKFCDINFRKPFYNKEIVETLLKTTDILKLNENELKETSEMFKIKGSYEEMMKGLIEKFNIEIICVTLGENGAMMLWMDKFYREEKIKVKVVDTVGAGDAFSAGFINGYINGLSPEEILKMANKLGAFVASKRGAIPEYNFEDIIKSEFF
ncbi:MAG: carbohydrate kinase family protein [Candidatus Ratteibacteria bacterium]